MMIPYQQLFPHDNEPFMQLSLPMKFGKVAKGTYSFVEAYCTEKECDCRRVCIFVVSPKGKTAAVIDFGFDPDDQLAGPFLDDMHRQSAAAPDLLGLFTDAVNEESDWVAAMYRRYRRVREHVDGKYKGKAFPKPGSVLRQPLAPPDMVAALEELLAPSVRPRRQEPSYGRPIQGSLFDGFVEHPAQGTGKPLSLASRIDRLARDHRDGKLPFGTLEDEGLLAEFRESSKRDEELAALLPKLIPRFPRDEGRISIALQLLHSLLEQLRIDLERQRPGARERMTGLQTALARQVFCKGGDMNLRAAVGRVLLESRVEILPVIQEANLPENLGDVPKEMPSLEPDKFGEEIVLGLKKAGFTTPHEALDVILDNLATMPPVYQTSMAAASLRSPFPLLREMAALMLFHPQQEVRRAVASHLREGRGELFSPETLRRLIISRNWFPPDIRPHLDAAIANARRAQVACAPLTGLPIASILATTIDGAGAQSIWIEVGSGKQLQICNILWKQGHGVIDTFIIPLPTARARREFYAGLPHELSFIEVAPWYLDRVVGHALALGTTSGGAPHRGFLQIAELLGTDQWQPAAIDPCRELAALRAELAARHPELLTEAAVAEALDDSASWPDDQEFADSWFEDDEQVDRLMRRVRKRKRLDEELALQGILQEVLEPRRGEWLERLTLMALWLKAAVRKPPVPWPHMYHLAETLANGMPMKDIPLMSAIAEVSYVGALQRNGMF